MSLLLDYTNVGRTRCNQIRTDALVFEVTHFVVGSSGYNLGTPATPLALVPAATSLVAEVKRVPVLRNVIELPKVPRGQEVSYCDVNGVGIAGAIGEAGLIATVRDPGTTGLGVGEEFLLAHAHFSRQILSSEADKLAFRWPLDFFTV